MPLTRAKLSDGQRAIFNYLFSKPDRPLVSFMNDAASPSPWLVFNNQQAKLLGQPEESRERIARFFAKAEIKALKNKTYNHPDSKINAELDERLKKATGNLKPKDNTEEFWQFIEDYYVRVLTLGFDPAKVKQSFIYQAKTMALYALGPSENRFKNLTAVKYLDNTIQRYVGQPERAKLFSDPNAIRRELGELHAELQAFDEVLKKCKPFLLPVGLINQLQGSLAYVTGVLAIFYFAGLMDVGTAVVIGLVCAIGLRYLNNIIEINNKKLEYLEQQYNHFRQLFVESIELHPVVCMQHDGSEVEVHVRMHEVDELHKKEGVPTVAPQHPTVTTVAVAAAEEIPSQKTPKRKHLASPASNVTAPRRLPSSKPMPITFSNGMVYDANDVKCSVKLIDANKKLYGYLNEQVVTGVAFEDQKSASKKSKVDEKEMEAFQRALATGKLLPANDRGRSGIKSIARNQNIFFYCPEHRVTVSATEKLKIESGARVFGHRVLTNDTAGANLTEFSFYAAAKQAHRY